MVSVIRLLDHQIYEVTVLNGCAVVVLEDVLHLFVGQLRIGLPSVLGPSLVHCTIKDAGARRQIGVTQGLHISEEVVSDSDGSDGFYREGLRTYINPPLGILDVPDDVVVDNELFHGERHSEFEHTASVDVVSPGQVGEKSGNGLLMSGLTARNLSVTLDTRYS